MLTLSSCGGGGGDSTPGITGVAHTNYIQNGIVVLYGIKEDNSKERIGQTHTDDKGHYTFLAKDITYGYKSYIVEATEGKYIDEAKFRQAKAVGKTDEEAEAAAKTEIVDPIRSITYLTEGEIKEVAITAATDIVVEALEAKNDFSKTARDDTSKKVVTKLLGASAPTDLNLFDTMPVNLDDTQAVDNSEKNQMIYSSLMSGLSELQHDSKKSIKEVSTELYSSIDSNQDTAVLAQFRESFKTALKADADANKKTGIKSSEVTAVNVVKTNQYLPNVAYKAGDKVVKDGIEYTCRAWGQGGAWCASPAYAPGGLLSSSAWSTDGGTATVSIDPNQVNYWSNQKIYAAGDKIFYESKAYECQGWPYTAWCQTRAPGSNGWMDAWKEYQGTYTVTQNVIDKEKEKTDDDIQQDQNTQANLPLRRPLLELSQSDNKYTLMIHSAYDNSSNRAEGYRLYKDGKLEKQVVWMDTQVVTAAIEVGAKNSKAHRFFVKTYTSSSSATGIIESESSTVQLVEAIKTVTVDTNQTQSLLTLNLTAFTGKVGQASSAKIFVNGGDGDGDIVVVSGDGSVAGVTSHVGYGQFNNFFFVNPVAVGSTSITVKKQASSDGTFKESNLITLPVTITAATTTGTNSNKKPGQPVISTISTSAAANEDFTLTWNMWWGENATTAKLYKDGVLIKTVNTTDFKTNKHAQMGGFGYVNATSENGSTHKFKVELCNGTVCTSSNERSVTFVAQNSGGTGGTGSTGGTGGTTNPPPIDNNFEFQTDHFAVGYYPTWSATWFSKASAANSKMVNIDPLYTHLVISFVKPDIAYTSNSFTGTGIQFNSEFSAVKEGIKQLKAKGVKVLLAVGGATYNNWTALANGTGGHRQAFVDLITDLDLDGLDVDYEINGSDHNNLEQYVKSIQALYSITQQTNTKLSIAGWSTGGDCTAATQSSDYNCQNKVSFWGGNAGRERQVFKMMKDQGLDPNIVFDYVSIMSYDGGFMRFDPVNAYKNYRDIYTGKLAVGFELPKEGWGGAELVSSNADAASCDVTGGKSSMLAGDSYQIFGSKKEYSVERIINNTILEENDANKGGIMLWSMYKSVGSPSACSKALDYDKFNISARKYLKGTRLTRDERLSNDINALHNQIQGFKTTSKFTTLQANAATLDGFTLDFSAIDSKITSANNAFSGVKDVALKTTLETHLQAINSAFNEQQSKYNDALLIKTELDRTKIVYENLKIKVSAGISAMQTNLDADIVTAQARVIFNDDTTTGVQAVIDIQKGLINTFKAKVVTEKTALETSLHAITEYSATNLQALEILEQAYIAKENSLKNELAALVSVAIVEINKVKPDDKKVTEGGTGTQPPSTGGGTTGTVSEVNILNLFTQKTEQNGTGFIITLTYTKDREINFRNAKIVISGSTRYNPDLSSTAMSWVNPTESYAYDATTEKMLTTMTFDTFNEKWVDTLFEGKGSTIILKAWPTGDIDLDNIKIVQITPGKSTVEYEDPAEAKTIRANPVSLVVKGWPSTLAMGSVTDNDFGLNQKFFESKVDSIFKYEGDGFGDRGDVIEPIVTTQTIRQAREIEALDGDNKTRVMPTLVVYTANGSGGGLAPNDIKTNYKTENSIDYDNNTVLADSNLVKHFRNTIRMVANMQANKDADHPVPATIVLDADLFGEWQKNKLNGTFQNEYCGGAADIDCATYKAIKIREAMLVAIEIEKDYAVKKYSDSAANVTKTESVGSLNVVYDLDAIKARITDVNIRNNIKGWVQSQNFMIKEFGPDVAFGWVINLWNPGSAHWVHKQYKGERDVWESASKGVAVFTKWIGAYDDNAYRPDFLTFDKYERDGFGAAGKPSYAFSSRAWDNYLMYVKQVTDFIDTPAMLWQIPGGHMATKTEDLTGASRLCSGNDTANCFRHLDTGTHGGHSASGGSYFMGDKKIGADIANIRDDVLNIGLSGVHYGNGVTNVESLLRQHDSGHDWGVSQLRHAAASNAFAILWGGGETTGSIPISTNKTGGYNWLKKKIVAYQDKGKIPLYHKKENSVTGGSNDLTSVAALNAKLTNQETITNVNTNIFLYNTGTQWIPSTVYNWEDFLAALKSMHNTGIAGNKYWLFDESDSDDKKQKYAKVAIAAFLAQSMKETIQYNACDENSWQFLKDSSVPSVAKSIARGDFIVDQPMDAACGQVGQNYANYGVDSAGVDNPYSCPRTPKMEVTANTNAKYYGAAAPIFAAPDSVLEDLGLLVDGKPGRWEDGGDCDDVARGPGFQEPTKEGWLREECRVYKGQKGGSLVWDGTSQRSLEGCGWWGRGVIQTTGRENFGKLNHYLGRSHVDKDLLGTYVDWAGGSIKVENPPENPLYADMDLCANPQLVCSSTKNKEVKWIAGLFFWINSVQAYNTDTGKYKDWDYQTELKKYVDSDFGKTNYHPVNNISFIDSVSGIVNRGCPDNECTTGTIDGKLERFNNFKKAIKALGIDI